jgi:hypothetical protein
MDKVTPGNNRAKIFSSPALERMTFISPVWFVVVWACSLTYVVYEACRWNSLTIPEALMLISFGFFTWALFEYTMHRYAFHWVPKNQLLRKFVYIMHGNHHEVPNDPMRNLMPPVVSIPIMGLIWIVFAKLLKTSGTWFFSGFLVGYILYDLIHYACHQLPMKGKVGQMFKRHHMRHHFIAGEGNYGVSALYLDRILKTRI